MSTFFAILSSITTLVICLSLVYYLAAMFAGMHELKKSGTSLAVQGNTAYADPFEDSPNTFDVYVMIPCLNEEAVIGRTVATLVGNTRTTTIVIDDGSEDTTAQIAREEGGEKVIVLRRELPNARQGKGVTLNQAYELIKKLVTERGENPERVLILVMDADGRLSNGVFSHILPLFEDPQVAGVQLAVRIRNRATNFLTRFQDFQFWAMSAVTQFGRAKTGTVSLGGNGQFTRLSALLALKNQPWSDSLTEDLDLAITLLSDGWKLTTTPDASVDQQGVESLRRLIVQRRRWYQGHMTAGRRLPDIWRNHNLSNARALELTAYLLVPWLFDLPWSILFHFTLYLFIIRAGSIFSFVTGPVSLVVGVTLWYLLTFAPAIMTTVVYFRRDRRTSFWLCLVLGHAFLVMNYLSFICAWGALWRILRGRTGWDKTKRTVENDDTPPTPLAPAR